MEVSLVPFKNSKQKRPDNGGFLKSQVSDTASLIHFKNLIKKLCLCFLLEIQCCIQIVRCVSPQKAAGTIIIGARKREVVYKDFANSSTRPGRPLRFIVHHVGDARRGHTDLQQKHRQFSSLQELELPDRQQS